MSKNFSVVNILFSNRVFVRGGAGGLFSVHYFGGGGWGAIFCPFLLVFFSFSKLLAIILKEIKLSKLVKIFQNWCKLPKIEKNGWKFYLLLIANHNHIIQDNFPIFLFSQSLCFVIFLILFFIYNRMVILIILVFLFI